MCSVEEIMACQISFVPIESKDYNRDIEKVLKIIKSSGLNYNIGSISTVVSGNKESVFSLIKHIYDVMNNECSFVLDIKLSNVCGCRQYIV